MAEEIVQSSVTNYTYVSDKKESTELESVLQMLFDQHLKVDVETVGGALHEDVHVRPVGRDLVFLNPDHRSGNEGIGDSILVPISNISSIHFRSDREYEMTQPR